MTFGQVLRRDASVTINGEPYEVQSHERELVETQPGDDVQEWEQRIENWALGWGHSQYLRKGTYDYASAANLHMAGRWLPGTAITAASPSPTPAGDVSFVEFWYGNDLTTRRLIAIASRSVYEINAAGTISGTSLTGIVASTAKMTKGIRFKSPSMSVPKIFIPVQGNASTDHFITRASAGSYAKNSGGERAFAMAAGKDIDGKDIVWRINEDGELNATTEDTDPNLSASWALQTHGAGETSVRSNDLFQQGRSLYVGREDGLYAFDLGLNSIPIMKGMEQTPDARNYAYFKENNGYVLAPTAQGLTWIEGLDWGMAGPVSTNQSARNLRGVEVAASGSAGAYVYSAVYFGGVTYIFLGNDRREGDNGEGPWTWHGPVASVAQRVTDLCISTITGSPRLWIGWVGGFGSMDLEEDFSPSRDLAAGYVYLPEGLFDMEGPGVIKDFRKAEFIAPAASPFAADNQWSIELETTPGSGTYVAVDGGAADSGVVEDRWWTTATAGQRLRARLAYTGNDGTGELEAVVVRGTHRPEKAHMHTMVLRFKDGQRSRRGRQEWRSAIDRVQALEALVEQAAKVVVMYGDETMTARIVRVREQTERVGHTFPPVRTVEIALREVVLS